MAVKANYETVVVLSLKNGEEAAQAYKFQKAESDITKHHNRKITKAKTVKANTSLSTEYKIGDILNAAEREMAPVECVKEDNICPKQGICKTFPIWKDINDEITKVLNSKTLYDYIERK